MHGLLINPYDRTISEVTTDGMYPAIKQVLSRDPMFSGAIDAVTLASGDVIYVDDEGLLSEGRPVFTLYSTDLCLAGVALILGVDDEGDSKSPVTTLAEAKKLIVGTNLETTGDFGPSREYRLPDGMWVYEGGKPVFRTKSK